MRTFLSAAVLAAAAATPALAQDTVPSPFNGAHIEAITGLDRPRVNGDGDNGVLYGVAGGYDVSYRGGLFGIEGEVADSSQRECATNVLQTGDRLCEKAKRDLYAGGRAGFVSGNTLIYGKVGYTNARFGASYQDGTTATAADFNDSVNLDGVRVGGGLETNVGRFLVKAEYRYSNYENDVSRHQGVVGVGVRF